MPLWRYGSWTYAALRAQAAGPLQGRAVSGVWQVLKRPTGRPDLVEHLATRCPLNGYELGAAVPYTAT